MLKRINRYKILVHLVAFSLLLVFVCLRDFSVRMALAILDNVSTSTWDPVDTEKGSSRGAVSELTVSTSVPIPSCSSGYSTPSTATPTVECNVHKSWVQKSENGDIRFVCMWGECYHTMDKKDELSAHFDVHLNYYVNDPTRREQDPFHCPILSCIHSASTAIELKRHLSMHMVQAHAQFIGRIMLNVKEEFQHLNSCGFDPSLQIFYDGEVAFCLWDQCNYGFTDISELFSHVSLHIDMLDNDDKCSNEYRCLWEQCFKTFLSKGDLRKHVRHHSGEKYCACPFCGRFFCRPDKLYEHLRRKGFAEEDAVFQCHLCQKNFADERTLINHVRRHLSGRQCPMCGLAVPLPSDLHKHIMVKHTERPRNYACRECGKEFYYENDLVRHGAVHGPPQFSCMLCDKKFRWKKQLDKHVLTHDVTVPKRPYLCHYCEAVYATGHGLTRHLNKRHDCPVPEGFSRFAYKKCADGYMRLQTRKLVRAELLP